MPGRVLDPDRGSAGLLHSFTRVLPWRKESSVRTLGLRLLVMTVALGNPNKCPQFSSERRSHVCVQSVLMWHADSGLALTVLRHKGP